MLIELLAATVLCCAVGQLPECSLSGGANIPIPTTMMGTINMSCSANPAAVVSSYVWEWYRLAPDNSIEERIMDGITSGINVQIPLLFHLTLSYPDRDLSVYTLSSECASSGIYQASYYSTADNSTCLFGCFFPIEVEETRQSNLREDFAIYRKCKGYYFTGNY